MKKILAMLLTMLCVLTLLSCEADDSSFEDDGEDREAVKEYDGVRITKLSYITVDYNGGYTREYVLDFDENKYYSIGYLPADNEDPELQMKSTFTDDAEKAFIDTCYSNGLFGLKKEYKTTETIYDGSGWTLTVNYEDGTSQTSSGDNAGPSKIFNKCSTCFYDLCGEEVMGSLPQYYAYPPNISYAFGFTKGNSSSSTNQTAKVVRADYDWNGRKADVDVYLLCEEHKGKNKFEKGIDYELTLYTANYDYGKKFNKFVVKQYDYNSELTNEKVVYSGKWIKQIDIELEMNKIYTYEMYYKDGNYVQYTFSTFCNE